MVHESSKVGNVRSALKAARKGGVAIFINSDTSKDLEIKDVETKNEYSIAKIRATNAEIEAAVAKKKKPSPKKRWR